MAEEIRYFLDGKGVLHKRRYDLNVSSDPGDCKVSNDALTERVSESDLRKYVGEDRCGKCFPRS